MPDFNLLPEVIALALIVTGFAFGSWALVENRFFSGVVRIQKDRGQTVVEGGPYRFLRHPSYAGALQSLSLHHRQQDGADAQTDDEQAHHRHQDLHR